MHFLNPCFLDRKFPKEDQLLFRDKFQYDCIRDVRVSFKIDSLVLFQQSTLSLLAMEDLQVSFKASQYFHLQCPPFIDHSFFQINLTKLREEQFIKFLICHSIDFL